GPELLAKMLNIGSSTGPQPGERNTRFGFNVATAHPEDGSWVVDGSVKRTGRVDKPWSATIELTLDGETGANEERNQLRIVGVKTPADFTYEGGRVRITVGVGIPEVPIALRTESVIDEVERSARLAVKVVGKDGA